jgi:acyl-CoA thioester hydrolase
VRLSLEPSTDPVDYPFSHDIRVRFAETDAMGVVHHAAYLPYLEEARVAYLRAVGRPYSVVRADGLDLAVLEVFTSYRRPLRFDEVVRVHLAVAAVTTASFQIAYLLAVDTEVRATAVTVHGCLAPSGRPTRVPAWLRDLASELRDQPSGRPAPRTPGLPTS